VQTSINVAGNKFKVEAQALTSSLFRLSVAKEGVPFGSGLNRYGFLREPKGKTQGVKREGSGGIFPCETSEAKLSVEAFPAGLSLDFSDSSGGSLTRGALSFEEKDGFRFEFNIAKGERFYGLGAQTSERIEHHGTRADLWARSGTANIPIPLLLSSRGYALLVNTTFRSAWDIGASDGKRMSVHVAGGNPDLYLIRGSTLKDLLMHYTELSGRPVLPPKWSFGLWFICHTEANQRDVVEDAAGFRERKIPCDIIGLEPGWMEKFYDLSVTQAWHPTRFYVPSWKPQAGPEPFIAALKRMGFKLELWLCNDYDLTWEAERQAQQTGAHLPVTGSAGSPAPAPEPAWFEHLRKFVDQGVDFFKQDEANQIVEHPSRRWGNGSHDEEMHNLYPLLYIQQMHDGFKAHTGRRPCCFTPVGFTGLQRYAGTWTGDVGGKAETLTSILNLAFCGHSLQTCDMEVTSTDSIHYGFLLPWAHVNSWFTFSQPWFLGEALYATFCDYARLRSQLIPYLYTYAQVAHTTGVPMLRPLALEFPGERAAGESLRQYLLGGELLVSAFTDTVHLPKGVWYDFWTGERLKGGRAVKIQPPANRGGGLFVRGNSILPLGPVTDYVGQPTDAGYTVHIYLEKGGQAEFKVYDDDGVSFDYEQGKCSFHRIQAACKSGQVAISLPSGLKVDTVILHFEKPPSQISVDGSPVSFEVTGPNSYTLSLG
jgi:alpha-glucosidase (family GH31 glycosyl hydrolase)